MWGSTADESSKGGRLERQETGFQIDRFLHHRFFFLFFVESCRFVGLELRLQLNCLFCGLFTWMFWTPLTRYCVTVYSVVICSLSLDAKISPAIKTQKPLTLTQPQPEKNIKLHRNKISQQSLKIARLRTTHLIQVQLHKMPSLHHVTKVKNSLVTEP